MGAARGAGQRARRLVLALVAVLVALIGAGVALRQAPASAQAARVSVGDILVVEPEAGHVLALDADNRTRQIQTGLNRPTGVTALADGSVLVADSGNNRIVGYGGRFADGVTVADGVPAPQALTTGSDGTVFVTLANGQVGKVDLAKEEAAQRYTKIAEGLRSPLGLVERGGFLYVAESGAGIITQVSVTGEKSPVGPAFGQPVGVAVGPGRILFVADARTNKVYRLDEANNRTDFVSVEGPQQLAVNPYQPGPDAPFTVTVAAKGSIQTFDRDGKRVFINSDVKGARGVSAVPASEAGGADLDVPTTRARVPASTVARGDADFAGGPTTSTYALIVSLVILGGLAIFAVLMFFIHEPKGSAQAGFEERPLDETVFEVFGPCANEEVELAEAEGALRSIATQRQQAEQQARDAGRRASSARDRANRAHHAKTKAGRARSARARAGQREPVPGLRTDELRLRSRGGNEALAAFRTGDIDAAELEERWRDLGEKDALECVQVIGVVVASKGQLSVDEVRASRAEERARDELKRADDDRRDAAREIERLREREVQAVRRIREARRELESCQGRSGGKGRSGRRSGRRGDDADGTRPGARPAESPVEAAPTPVPVTIGARGGAAEVAATAPHTFAVPGATLDDATTQVRFRRDESGRRVPVAPPEQEDDTSRVRFRRDKSPGHAAARPPERTDRPSGRNGGWPPAPPPSVPLAPPAPAPPRSGTRPPPPPPRSTPVRAEGPDPVTGFLWDVNPQPRGESPRDRTGERPRPTDPVRGENRWDRTGERPRPTGPVRGENRWDRTGERPRPTGPSRGEAPWERTGERPRPADPRRSGDRPVAGPRGDGGRYDQWPPPPRAERPPPPPPGPRAPRPGRSPRSRPPAGVNGGQNGRSDDWVPPPPPFEPLWPPSSTNWGPASDEPDEADPLPPYRDGLNGNGRLNNGHPRPDEPPRGRRRRR